MEKYYKARLKYVNSEIKDTYRATGIKKAIQIHGKSVNKIYGGEGNYKLIKDMKWLNFLCGEITKKKEIVRVSNSYDYKTIEEEKEVEHWLWAIGLDTILTISDGKAKDIWTGKVYKCEPIEKMPEKTSSDFDLSDLVLEEYEDDGIAYSNGFKFKRQRNNTKEESFNGFHQYDDEEKHDFILTYDEERPLDPSFITRCIADIESLSTSPDKVLELYDKQFEEFKKICQEEYNKYNMKYGYATETDTSIISNEAKIKTFLDQHCLANKNQH